MATFTFGFQQQHLFLDVFVLQAWKHHTIGEIVKPHICICICICIYICICIFLYFSSWWWWWWLWCKERGNAQNRSGPEHGQPRTLYFSSHHSADHHNIFISLYVFVFVLFLTLLTYFSLSLYLYLYLYLYFLHMCTIQYIVHYLRNENHDIQTAIG